MTRGELMVAVSQYGTKWAEWGLEKDTDKREEIFKEGMRLYDIIIKAIGNMA